MASDNGVEAARSTIQFLLPKIKMPGLTISNLAFDYVRQSFTLALARPDKKATLVLPAERLSAIKQDEAFSVKRLREDIFRAFGEEA